MYKIWFLQKYGLDFSITGVIWLAKKFSVLKFQVKWVASQNLYFEVLNNALVPNWSRF